MEIFWGISGHGSFIFYIPHLNIPENIILPKCILESALLVLHSNIKPDKQIFIKP